MHLRMAPNQNHACKVRKYTPGKFCEIYIYRPNFVFYVRNKSKTVNLIIFDSDDKKQCYDFQFGGKNEYYCKECRKKKKNNIYCTLLFDNEGKEYLKLKSGSHCCVPLKFSTLKASGIKIQETSGQNVEKKKVDENQIVKEDNFELRPNRVGVPNAKLFIFSSADKILCYEFSFRKFKDKYVCNKCSHVSAKLIIKEDGKKFVELGDGLHKCEPVSYKEELKTVPASNFIIHSSNKKHIVSKLILFSNPDQNLCYVYYHNGQCKNYYCRACFVASKKKVVTAKHLKNDKNEAYLLLSDVKHLCTPQPYDPKEFNEIPKIRSSRFEVLYNSTIRSRLFVFDANDIFKAHVFRPSGKGLGCRGCGEAKKFTGANLYTNESGGTYVELDESKHICKPENLLRSEMLVKSEFFEQSTDDNGNEIITTYHGENKTLFRTFVYDNQLQVFQCPKCVEKDRIVTAKICKRSDDKEYLLLYSTHICKPVLCDSGFKKQRKETQLLTFDDNNKICYSGNCSVSINALSMYLTATPKTEDLKPVCAPFDSDIVQEKNILFNASCVQKFALVFASEVTCKKVKDAISKYTDLNTPQRSVKENFLISLFDEYDNADIAKITNKLLNAYNCQERNEIILFLQEKSIHENICVKLLLKNSNTVVKGVEVRGDNIHGALDSENHETSNKLTSKANRSSYNNSHDDGSVEDGNDVGACQRRKPREMSKIKKKLKKPDYELVEGSINGKKKTRLIIFESDKTFCTEFFWDSNIKAYLCCGCASLRERSVKAVIYYVNTTDEYVELYHNHACQPREYANLKILNEKQSIQAPDFELQTITKDGNERKRLIIFASSNRSLCYKYSAKNSQAFTCHKCAYKGLKVKAHLRVDNNGKEYVVLGKEAHVCDLQPYVPVNVNSDTILEPPLFEVFPQTKGKPKIFIFESLHNKKQGYLFSHHKKERYICLGCEKIRGVTITVELCQKENGEYFVIMKSSVKHECKIREYQPQKWREVFVYPPHFFFYTKGTKHPQLVVFCSEDKKLCHDYKFCGKNVLRCKACKLKNHYQSALVFQDPDGNEFLQLGINEHICQPAEYEDVEGTGLTILSSSGIKCPSQFKRKKVDESKIVKNDGFLLLSDDSILDSGTKLLVFDKNDKSMCFKYSYQKNRKRFHCLKCHRLNVTVSAKLNTKEEDNNTKYLILGENDHRCEPEKYEPKNVSVKITDFLVFEPNNNKWKTSKLVIFASPNHSMCYVYSFCNTRKHYVCHECISSETRKCVSAKILKDENALDYVLFNKFDHICRPVKYDPLDYETPKIPSSRFEILPNLWGTPNSRLFIFDAENPNLCYEFSKKSDKIFECRGCFDHPDGKKYTRAELFQNENGESYVAVDETKHVCKIQDFKALKRLFTADDFEITSNSKREKILSTFHGKSKNLCYKFTYDNELQVYRCLECKGKYVTAKVCKRNKSEEYVLLSYIHCCKATTRMFHQNTN